MKVVALEQRSPEWQDWRRQGVTASDAAVLLGESSHKDRLPALGGEAGVIGAAGYQRQPECAARRSSGRRRPSGDGIGAG